MVPFLPQGAKKLWHIIAHEPVLHNTPLMYSISPTKLTMGAHSTHMQEIELKVGVDSFEGGHSFTRLRYMYVKPPY